MHLTRLTLPGCALGATVLVLAGCGSSKSTPASTPTTSPTATTTTSSSGSTTASGGSGAGALSADARSAATGDIPDNQIFLTFVNRKAGYSMKYPEGWTRTGSAATVSFRDKNNLVRVVIARGPAPTPGSVARQLKQLKSSNSSLNYQAPAAMKIGAASAVKVVYTTQSAPNPVTGKHVLLIVDRYELAHGGRVATVDLGTPKGVDNVDAYRMMIESFQWR